MPTVRLSQTSNGKAIRDVLRYRVLMVDRSTFPSDVISTHFLWPHGTSYLNRWGLLDRVLATTPSHTELQLVNDGIPLIGGVPEELLRQYFQQLHGDDSGVVRRYCSVRRRVLDKILVDAAGESGVEVREGFAVDRHRGGWARRSSPPTSGRT